MNAEFVVQESGGFVPKGKYHLAHEELSGALCGIEPRHGVHWNVTGERSLFEQHDPERICKNCRKAEF